MPQLLPRHLRYAERAADLARIVAIIEAAETEAPTTVSRATLAGDTRRMRGVPICGPRVGSTAPGTDPVRELLAKEARLGRA